MKNLPEPQACPLLDLKWVGLPANRRESSTCMVTRKAPKTYYYYCQEGLFVECPEYTRAFFGLKEERLKEALAEGISMLELLREIIKEEIANMDHKK